MKKTLLLSLLALAIVLTEVCWNSLAKAPAAAQDVLTVLTARKTSLYYQAATELKHTLDGSGFVLDIKESPGSFQNLEALGQGKADLAFAQQDALVLLRNLSDPKLAQLANHIQVFSPVNTEVVHIIVNAASGIHSFHDLIGKTVGIGPENSGTHISAILLYQLYNVDVTQEHFADLEIQTAIEKVRTGQLDAAFYTAGIGAPLLKNISAKRGAALKLLSIDRSFFAANQKLFNDRAVLYVPQQIAAHTYPWQQQATDAISTFSSLYINKAIDTQKVYRLAKAVDSKASVLRGRDPFWQLLGFTRAGNQAFDAFDYHPGVRKLMDEKQVQR